MIKFIYFDVGGVVVKDFSSTNKWEQLKKDLGVKKQYSKKFDDFFDRYERGVCLGKNIQTLVPSLEQKFNLSLPKKYSFLHDFVNRFEKNKSIWSVIKKGKTKYKIGLLTNMYPNMLDLIKQKKLIPQVTWDIIIDSSIEKVAKPDNAIFELAQKRTGLKANEILFVENSKAHINTANLLGWKTFLYDSSDYEKSSKILAQSI